MLHCSIVCPLTIPSNALIVFGPLSRLMWSRIFLKAVSVRFANDRLIIICLSGCRCLVLIAYSKGVFSDDLEVVKRVHSEHFNGLY